MGVSFSSKVAVGVRLGKVWESRTISEQVKKFNPDTGEPYMATVSKEVIYFCGKPTDWKYGPRDHESDIGLDICVDNHDKDEYDWIVGKKLYEAGATYRDEKSIVEIKDEDIEAAKKEVFEKLAKFGFTEPSEIRAYLIAYVSY